MVNGNYLRIEMSMSTSWCHSVDSASSGTFLYGGRIMVSIRVATWNTKQGVAPRKAAPVLWEWVINTTKADVLVLTEAKVPKDGLPAGWTAIYQPGGVDKRRQYGTIVAARGLSLRRTDFKRRKTRREEDRPHPATTFAVDVSLDGELAIRIIAAYGLLAGTGNGLRELRVISNEVRDVIRHHGNEEIVLAGDFNLWPDRVVPTVEDLGLVDVTGSRTSLPDLETPSGGSRIWTHKNGPKYSRGARQELDYIFVASHLARGMRDISGGVHDFPDSWEMSDHSPVAVTLSLN